MSINYTIFLGGRAGVREKIILDYRGEGGGPKGAKNMM